MDIQLIFGSILFLLVGITLGLIGSGGSIMSVPILVYVLKIEPVLATSYSLFIVGITALFGGIQKAKDKLVDFSKVLLFGIPSVVSVFFTRKILVSSMPQQLIFFDTFYLSKSKLILLVFSCVMVFSAYKMIVSTNVTVNDNSQKNYLKIILKGIFIGLIAGFVGAGGGFLIIPALLYYTNLPMKVAVGTSLFIVAIQCLVGFFGDVVLQVTINWKLLQLFTFVALCGSLIGSKLAKKLNGNQLKLGFGWFMVCIGIYIVIKEII